MTEQGPDGFPPSVFQKLPTAGMPFVRPAPNMKQYAPGRDLAYVYPLLIHDLQRRIEQRYSDKMIELMSRFRTGKAPATEEEEPLWAEINAVHMAVVKFLQNCCANSEQTLTEVLLESGYLDLSQDARAMWLAAFGAQGLAVLFSAIRDVSTEGEKPPKYLDAEMRRATDVFQLLLGSSDPQINAMAKFKDAMEFALTAGVKFSDMENCISQRKVRI